LFPTRGFAEPRVDRRAAPWTLNVVGARGARDLIWIAVADATTLEGQEEIQRVHGLFPEAKGHLILHVDREGVLPMNEALLADDPGAN
jgi:hypothetical protein